MISMQYSFTLPADYDMGIIRKRVADKGPMLDDYDGLRFKAYLVADRADPALGSAENLYAPFYLWPEAEQMQRFLDSPVFPGVANAFGWPSIKVWPVWNAHLSAEARQARFATREIAPIAPFTAIAELKKAEHEALRRDVAQGAVAAVSAFEPTGWTSLRFRLWRDRPALAAAPNRQFYAVGHVSQPKDNLE
jgi:hypothetical protein